MNERKHQHAILEQHVGQAVVFNQNCSHVLAVQNWVGSTGFWERLELLKGRFEGVIEVLPGAFAVLLEPGFKDLCFRASRPFNRHVEPA